MRAGKGLRYLKRVKARGKWYGYFDTGQTDAAGKRIYAAVGRMDDSAFGAKYAAMLGRRTARENVATELLVPALVNMFQRSEKYRSLAVGTKRGYDIYLKALVEALPSAPASKVERRDVVLLLDKMADRPGAANLLLAVIGAVYDWGRDREHVTNDPTKDISRFKIGEHDPWPDWLVEEALTSDDNTLRLAVHLLYFTAQRIGDVCAMRWSDIRGGRLSVNQQKTDKDLDIPMHARLRAVLDATPKAGLTILTKRNGLPMSTGRLRDILKAWATKRGQAVVPHGLRKNAVNALLEAECSVAETAAISGQTLQMVEHYARKRNQSSLASAAVLKWERNKK